MILTNENYYSVDANLEYMSVSQYKDFRKCEAMALATLRGEWEKPKTTALLVGSYIDSWFEGTLDEFKEDGVEIVDRNIDLETAYIENEEWTSNQERLHKAISQLTPRQQEMVRMIYFEGKTQEEVRAYYGIAKSSMSEAMQRIFDSLKKFLEKN